MTNKLEQLLNEKPFLLADGAVGTNLFAAGLQSGDAPELWNIDAPEKIHALHRGFVDAGSDIILTNSFGGTSYRLKLHNAQDRVHELNLAAAKIARSEADRTDHTVIVAGSMGPTGELMEPMGTLTHEGAVAAFKAQAEALIEGGVDVLWIETMSSKEEVAAAVDAVRATGYPFVCTMSFDTNRRTMMGIKPSEYTEFCHELPVRPIGWGANCGVGAGEMLETVLGLKSTAAAEDIIVAKANCGIPEFKDGALTYSGTLEVMAEYARLAADAGARIIGGCCGTSHAHLKAMADALDGYAPKPNLGLPEIEAHFGPVWQTEIPAGATHGASGGSEGGRRSGRRRRN
ncbi:betaine--homocysteine S-methyltransferase [uncultured Sneathiella sp.]|jgi:5-methyltetrahydrofolate--homocysteine methyltransferase|uniref:betaine--homocysteine S-methyltransferase n=1 Tax=uncultured Sneathiella sp. TaxID=879315 RepID=UPI0030D7D819|tara:strand:+ start:16654 stop:17688 length:1035 start_codon:yes stop_codon:yes gene_type:complete